jgi:hypothetical protein
MPDVVLYRNQLATAIGVEGTNRVIWYERPTSSWPHAEVLPEERLTNSCGENLRWCSYSVTLATGACAAHIIALVAAGGSGEWKVGPLVWEHLFYTQDGATGARRVLEQLRDARRGWRVIRDSLHERGWLAIPMNADRFLL